jgi:hypothetical protein
VAIELCYYTDLRLTQRRTLLSSLVSSRLRIRFKQPVRLPRTATGTALFGEDELPKDGDLANFPTGKVSWISLPVKWAYV